MKSSRSSANIFSESTNDVRRANQVRIVCATRDAARMRDDLVDVPGGRPLSHRLDEPSEQRRAGQPGCGRGRVEEHDERRSRRGGGARAREPARAAAGPAAIGSRSLTSRPPRGSRGSGSRATSGAARGGVPAATARPPSNRTTRSARSSTSGLVVTITVVLPARASRSRSAIRASVCASTALVGSTRTSVSASESSARASTSRCRWPPENERPRSSTGASSPSGSGSSTSSAFAIPIASQIRPSWPFAWPHGSSS